MLNGSGWRSATRQVAYRSFLLIAPLVGAVGLQSVGASSVPKWESPFQAGTPDPKRDKLRPVPSSRCDHEPYNNCTFSARIDYDGDGAPDTVRMMDGTKVSALVVEFGGKPKRALRTIASFKGRWTGSCYIAAAEGDFRALAFTCPEVSSAIFKMRGGKPAAYWTGD